MGRPAWRRDQPQTASARSDDPFRASDHQKADHRDRALARPHGADVENTGLVGKRCARGPICRGNMKLVIFDIDGTLVDSQHEITHAMNSAMAGAGLPEMEPARILSIVGLSLPVAVARLLPEAGPDLH